MVAVGKLIKSILSRKQGVSGLSAPVVLHVWAEHSEMFNKQPDVIKYQSKRVVNKAFTEVVLSSSVGCLFNKVLIWEVACFGSELIYKIVGDLKFNLAAVGSYSIVC
jgi:hypothetical protein